MKKKLFRFVNMLLMVVLCVTMLAPAALAATDTASVKIPVEVKLKGTLPYKPEKFTIQMAADDKTYPMPEGTEDGVATVTIEGKGKATFGPITFDRVGVYTYNIRQINGTNRKCSYDKTIYYLTVYVTNAKDGGLDAAAVLYASNEDDKVDEAVFLNKYRVENPEIPQTDDQSNFPLYATLAGGSVMVLILLFLTRKRKDVLDDYIEQ